MQKATLRYNGKLVTLEHETGECPLCCFADDLLDDGSIAVGDTIRVKVVSGAIPKLPLDRPPRPGERVDLMTVDGQWAEIFVLAGPAFLCRTIDPPN